MSNDNNIRLVRICINNTITCNLTPDLCTWIYVFTWDISCPFMCYVPMCLYL